MKTKKKADKAFTLAEVLITLTIIGVIAAITVPVLVQKTQKQEYVSALQKAYSTLSQVTNQIIAENGSPKCSDGGWACTDEDIYNMYKKYINNLKECGVSDRCFETPSSAASWWEKSFFASSNAPRFIMADGVHVMIEFSGSNSYKSCTSVSGAGTRGLCAVINVDVNGSKKPLKLGRDVFRFALKENGLYPYGCDDGCQPCPDAPSNCACRILKEGAMNY